MERDNDTNPLPHPLHFDALLVPHRSLTPKGFLFVMIFVGVVSFVAGLAFLLMGAWPVFGFFGLDVALIYWALRRNFRDAKAFERVQLSDGVLKILKVDAKGEARAWSLAPYWARVELERADEEDVAVHIRSHGKQLGVAAFLSPQERVEFGIALADALTELRQGGIRYH